MLVNWMPRIVSMRVALQGKEFRNDMCSCLMKLFVRRQRLGWHRRVAVKCRSARLYCDA